LYNLDRWRQAPISDIENGKREVKASELTYFCGALDKLVIYFFPDEIIQSISYGELEPEQQELLRIVNTMTLKNRKKLIAIGKTLIE